jgi:hypothetical protein
MGTSPAQPQSGTQASAMGSASADDSSAPTSLGTSSSIVTGLAKYVRDAYEAARDNRNLRGVDEDLLGALRAVRGQYSQDKLSAIQRSDSSEVYLRISANKVRSVAASLRDVYTSTDRPWMIQSTAEPETPYDDQTEQLIKQMLMNELQQAQMDSQAAGQPLNVTPQMLFNRRRDLRDLLYQHKVDDSNKALGQREDQYDDILQQGGFYQALWDFLEDIATFPYAVLKGPVVYYKPQLHWENGKAVVKTEPTMTWERCSPFDVYFAPWSQSAQDGYIVHKQRCTRAALQSLIGLPSYNSEAIQEVLDRQPDAFKDWWSYTEMERSILEQRESDMLQQAKTNSVDRPFPMLEYHGSVSGELLAEWGMDKKLVPDVTKDLNITCWLIDNVVIGVRINPHPMGRKPFYVDSFERVPGSIFGLGVPKMIEDIQDGGNATLRALVNNLAISSGPQVAVNEGRLDPNEKDLSMWPWKVWSFTDDPTGAGNSIPVSFFQPNSNAGELLAVLKQFIEFADMFSSMPQFMQGQAQGMATVGRSASGLSMMMDAANRTMKQSVTSIDKNVIEPAITDLNVYLSLLRPDLVDDGDINVVAKGATQLVNRDQLRMRRLEFLQVTGSNPVDMQIIGVKGRARIITEIAKELQLPVDDVVTGTGQPSGPLQQIGGQPGQPSQPGVNGQPGQGAMGTPPGPAPQQKSPSQMAPQPALSPAPNSQPAAAMAAPTQG